MSPTHRRSNVESDMDPAFPIEPYIKCRWVIAIDGTWADRNSKGGSTVIADLGRVLSKTNHHQFVEYLEGVGTSASIVEKLHGGLTGLGIDRQILRAYSFLIANWREGDEIVITGYSRGAYAGIILADLISRVGIPQVDPATVRNIYKGYKRGDLDTINHCNRVSNEFECKPATILALALFDAVESLGIPKTGVLGFLRWFAASKRKNVNLITPLKRVQNIFHALAIHEYRRPFCPNIIHLPPANKHCNLVQVWFIGSHRDLGNEDRHCGGLVDTPLAWMISMLRSIGVKLNSTSLRKRFPSYPSEIATPRIDPDANAREWAYHRISRTYKGLATLLGYQPRTPGRYILPPGVQTNEFVHISVRDRGYGSSGQAGDILPGLKYVNAVEDGSGIWSSQGLWSSDERQGKAKKPQVVLPEALLDPFEASLQGFHLT